MDRSQNNGHVERGRAVRGAADPVRERADITHRGVIEPNQRRLDRPGLLTVVIRGRSVAQKLGQVGSFIERAALDHAGEEVVRLRLLPEVGRKVLPMVGDVLQVGLDHGLGRKRRTIQLLCNGGRVAFLDELVGETNQRRSADRRSIVLGWAQLPV